MLILNLEVYLPMQPAKKVEIIVNEPELPKILKALDKAKVSGYTVMHNVSGRGSYGVSSDDMFTNAYVMTVCPDAAHVEKIIETLQPVLKKLGGICMVTDTLLLTNLECK